MEAVSFICLLFFVPVAAMATTFLMLQSRDRQLKRLELQVLDLHDRLQNVEVAPPMSAPPVPAAIAESTTTPDSLEALAAELDVDPLATEPLGAEAQDTPTVSDPSATPPPPPSSDGLDFEDHFPEAKAWERPSPERVAVWIGAVLGAFTLAVGGLFAVVAAVEAGWLGPGFRVGGAMALGSLAWVLGGAVRPRAPRAASALSAAGVATIFGAIWAATSLYALLPTGVGFAALVAVVAATLGYAARIHDRFLANLALLGGLLASVVVSGSSTALQLGYILILNVAIAMLCSRRPWSELLLLVGAGSALQLLGFTATDRVPDQQLFALIGIAAVLVPHAITAARSSNDGNRVASTVSAGMVLLLAAAWVPSLTDSFYDPRSGLSVITNPSVPWEATLGFIAILLPLWLAGRGSKSVALTGIATLLAIPSLFAFAIGWAEDPLLHLGVPLAITAGLCVVFAGQRDVGEGIVPWFPAVALVYVDIGPHMPDGLVIAALLGLTVLALAGSLFATTSLAPVLLLPAAALVMLSIVENQAAPTAGPAIAVLIVLFSGLAVRHWKAERLEVLPWIAAVVAPTAFMPAAYVWWMDHLGDGVIGALPLLIAGWTLLVAMVLLRRHRVSVHSATFSIGVLAVLGGITLALPLQLQERWLTVGWALEGALLAWLSQRLRHPLLQAGSVGLGMVVATRLLLNPWALSWGDATGWPVLNWTLYTWGIPTVCLLVSAHFLKKTLDPKLKAIPVALRLTAMMTGFAMLNVQVSHAFQDQGALSLYGTTTLQGMTRSITWGGYGLFLLVAGLVAKSRATRFLGFGFILLSALKVFLLDVWSLPGMVRVGSLVGLGLFLLVSAFLFERLVLRERSPKEGE